MGTAIPMPTRMRMSTHTQTGQRTPMRTSTITMATMITIIMTTIMMITTTTATASSTTAGGRRARTLPA